MVTSLPRAAGPTSRRAEGAPPRPWRPWCEALSALPPPPAVHVSIRAVRDVIAPVTPVMKPVTVIQSNRLRILVRLDKITVTGVITGITGAITVRRLLGRPGMTPVMKPVTVILSNRLILVILVILRVRVLGRVGEREWGRGDLPHGRGGSGLRV